MVNWEGIDHFGGKNGRVDSAVYGDGRNVILAFLLLVFFASARRSVFLRRAARFLALSLPWLFPIGLHTRSSAAHFKLSRVHAVSRCPKHIALRRQLR